jgi:hypothetical protein
MIKSLKKALGTAGKKLGVIGRIDISQTGKSIIEIGHGFEDGSWEKITDGGHIALSPQEREVLIKTLESHREYQVIEIGDTVAVEYTVLAVQYLNATADGGKLRGTILAYAPRKRQWAVLTAFPNGTVEYGSYTYDEQRALNVYVTRVTEHLFPHFNAKPPTLTYAAVADRDKLKGDQG